MTAKIFVLSRAEFYAAVPIKNITTIEMEVDGVKYYMVDGSNQKGATKVILNVQEALSIFIQRLTNQKKDRVFWKHNNDKRTKSLYKSRTEDYSILSLIKIILPSHYCIHFVAQCGCHESLSITFND